MVNKKVYFTPKSVQDIIKKDKVIVFDGTIGHSNYLLQDIKPDLIINPPFKIWQ